MPESSLLRSVFPRPFPARKSHLLLPVPGLLVSLLLAACSQYSTAPANRAFHNLTARYNAELQAEEQLGEAEKLLFRARQDNYAQPLPILPPLDSMAAQAVATQLDAVLKKASLVAERHQNSKWLDNAYLLIGRVRLIRGDFKNAIETFKYINTTSEEPLARQEALIGLMRAYVETDDYASGLRVADLLRTLPLSASQTRLYYLTKALLHQRRGEASTAAALVEEALPLMKKGEAKARALYAQGQLYDQVGKADKAAASYAAVLANRPPYDLAFYADLNRLLNGTGEEKTFNFARMLDDRKNADLKDRIYYAMATKELSRKNYRQAVRNLELSAQYAAGKPDQLAFTFLKLAELNYDPLRRYEAASAYYDSTVALLSPVAPGYARISERQKVLREFAKYQTTLRTEDSLQRLARMNPAALDKYLEKSILDQREREAREVQRAQQIAAQSQQEASLTASTNAAFGGNASTGLWYFYNANALSQGKREFQQKWGNRPLEDNWRRSSKENTFADAPTNGTRQLNATSPTAVASVGRDELKGEKDKLLAQVPFSAQALASSQQRKEEALFQIGKIYQLNLRENDQAVRTFGQLLTDFPQTQHEPEALYLLALLHEGKPQQADFQTKLTTKYPESSFARLLTRGAEGPLSAGAQSAAQRLYTEAYDLYGAGKYSESLARDEQGLRDYPGNGLEDKYALLHAMLVGKLQGPGPYQQALTQFIQNYPASPLLSLAREMLTTANQTASAKGN